jgi:hypothetical protein
MFREQKLGTGRNRSSDVQRFGYSADPRDARVYWAERGLRLAFEQDPRWQGWEPWFVDVDHAQVWVDLALSRDWPGWNPTPVRVQTTHLGAAHYRGAIYIPQDPRWLRGLIVLHELAHHFVGRRLIWHDDDFVRAFGDLLAGMFDPGAGELFLGFLSRGER